MRAMGGAVEEAHQPSRNSWKERENLLAANAVQKMTTADDASLLQRITLNTNRSKEFVQIQAMIRAQWDGLVRFTLRTAPP